MKKTIYSLCLMLGLIVLAGCEGTDGRWSSIKLTVNGKRYNSVRYKVPERGGEYKVRSKNYGGLWLNYVRENYDSIYRSEDIQNACIKGDWFEVRHDDKHNIVVSVQPMSESDSDRSITLAMSMMDAFKDLEMVQSR